MVGKAAVPAPGRARLKEGEFDISLSYIDALFRQNKPNTTTHTHTQKNKQNSMRTKQNQQKWEQGERDDACLYTSQQLGREVVVLV